MATGDSVDRRAAGGKISDALDISVGGNGGVGGSGGSVSVTNDGFIKTLDDNAAGIRAMSVGGGGGDAGLVANLSLSLPDKQNSAKRVAINIGGTGGEGGTGGDVTSHQQAEGHGTDGRIETHGKKA